MCIRDRVVTVQGLANGRPHPVQEALVRELGSQCGYCTPGVVMSMFEACYRRDLRPEDDAGLDDQMCGNLCRCTGYRPIRDATRAIAGSNPDDAFQRALVDAARPSPISYERGTRYLAPSNFPALFDALDAHPGARIVCGGTDLVLDVTKKH